MSDIIGTPILHVNRYSNPLQGENIGMSIGSRIREARRAAKLTQKALAQKVGMSQGALSELETGESQSSTLIASMAAALGVSALWLETGKGVIAPVAATAPAENASPFVDAEGDPEDARPVRVGADRDMVEIPRVKLRLRAGVSKFDTEPDMDGDGHEEIASSILATLGLNARNLLAVRVRGVSMEPMMFEDDVVIIDKSDTKPISREVYAVNFDGEACIKQLLYRGGQWYLHSVNPDFGPVNARSGQCSIVGRVVIQPTRVLTGRL